MKAVGFNGGQFGDVVMGMVAARAHKEQFRVSFDIRYRRKIFSYSQSIQNNPR